MKLNINERHGKKKIKEWKCEDKLYINKIKQIYVYSIIPFYYF